MPHRFDRIPMPASRTPVSLLAVDRAVSDMRRGRVVAVRGAGGVAALALAAEALTPEGLAELTESAGTPPALAITARRAAVLGFRHGTAKVVTVSGRDALDMEMIANLADPLSGFEAEAAGEPRLGLIARDAPTYSCEAAAVGLTKLARLLPSALVAEVADPEAEDLAAWVHRRDFLLVESGDVFQYEHTAARTPLLDAEDTRIVAFRPEDSGLEHLAVIIGRPKPDRPPLTRLHSECFTGDLLGSLRCDCGDQLRGAIEEISKGGGGILLYLAQEGRGIGLVNKLRAYELQDRGLDTMDANEQLGFDADERVYQPAAHMLRHLGFEKVRLLSNNPGKVDALAQAGITVIERVPHAFPSNRHNERYLRTKAMKGGHLF